jgi:DNA polymerase
MKMNQTSLFGNPNAGQTSPNFKSQRAAIKAAALDELNRSVEACRNCALGSGRIQAVPGGGNPDAQLVFIGEAPGANEDKQGIPFIGAAGKLLTKNLERNGISREEIYICNIIKCRPPQNRDPLPAEIAACTGFLHRQLEIIQPKIICTLGRFAAAVLLGSPIKITQVHGTWHTYRGIPFFISLHPSAVIYQQKNRAVFEADMDALAASYRALGGESSTMTMDPKTITTPST